MIIREVDLFGIEIFLVIHITFLRATESRSEKFVSFSYRTLVRLSNETDRVVIEPWQRFVRKIIHQSTVRLAAKPEYGYP